jgi:hypothetical protein
MENFFQKIVTKQPVMDIEDMLQDPNQIQEARNRTKASA